MSEFNNGVGANRLSNFGFDNFPRNISWGKFNEIELVSVIFQSLICLFKNIQAKTKHMHPCDSAETPGHPSYMVIVFEKNV